MKVRCLVLEEREEEAPCANPDCKGHAYMPVWGCVHHTPSATIDSFFYYEVTESEDEEFGGIAEGKFVELAIEEIGRGVRGIIRMKGTVSKVACDYNTRAWDCNAKSNVAAEIS
jgi:hypothetical protein